MYKENKKLEKLLRLGRKIIPKRLFRLGQPVYHWGLSNLGAARYRWPSSSFLAELGLGKPSHRMKVIGVTGTHGKSTTVLMISKIFEEAGYRVAAIGSLGMKIVDKEWENTVKMTMPGRMKLQHFLAEAKAAGCQFVILEVTSEGLAQMRHIGIQFDCAVLTNIGREHIESHGSFEKYLAAKQKLFRRTQNIHILNGDDAYIETFNKFKTKKKLFYGWENGDITAIEVKPQVQVPGRFNIYNALAALTVAKAYGLDIMRAKDVLEKIDSVPGRMEFIQKEPFNVVVDYAHTPDSLEAVYKELRSWLGGSDVSVGASTQTRRLICVLGATGGGRDKWKRPVYGQIASKYCDEIILTNEDPYDEDPLDIINQIEAGVTEEKKSATNIILDRRAAIEAGIRHAQPGDSVIITGKGSEILMAMANDMKIPWSDKDIAQEILGTLQERLIR